MITPSHAPTFSLCVYCGSRSGNSPAYEAVAQEVGTWIGQHRGELVYGGGNAGLMGVVARATLAAGGRVYGVIPQALVTRECALQDCTELHTVDTMHERKAMMADRADAFLALPGGVGTFEELFEVWTWRQLGYHSKPIGLLNTDGYYDGLLTFMEQTVGAGFVSNWQMDLLMTDPAASALLPALVQQAGFGSSIGLAEKI
ncbi:MAG: TIGR00730 family Rossman fold protein [Burkholderiaceae bacterium]